jgi:hydrogenase maturation protein HypF
MRIFLEGPLGAFGYRPTVYRVAQQLRLTGWVRNFGEGIEIEIEGRLGKLDGFLQELKRLSHCDLKVTTQAIQRIPAINSMWFEILPDVTDVLTSRESQVRAEDLTR